VGVNDYDFITLEKENYDTTSVIPCMNCATNGSDHLLYVDRRDGRKCWYHAPREGGDVTSSEVKSKDQEMDKRRNRKYSYIRTVLRCLSTIRLW
jgi:hypothetical protein